MGIFIRNNLPNNLHPDEKAQGWRLLWDGKTAKGWRSAHGSGIPGEGLVDGRRRAGGAAQGGGGDIVTDEEFGAFELQLEFKVTAGANSGIFYLLTSPHDPASGAPLGLEYQILDDERHPDAKLGDRRQSHAGFAVRHPAAGEADDQCGYRTESRRLAARAHRVAAPTARWSTGSTA